MSWFGKRGGFLLVVLSVVGWLLFANLGNVYLWQDEAETALLAKNLLEYGYPMAYDGKNLITQNAGLDSNAEHVWIWSPWLQFYVTAASFKLFGIDTLPARLPFALIGLATVAFFYFAARELLRKERDARIATVILGTSIPFLLHARQARWYVLAVITSIWVLHAYTRMRERKRSSAMQIVGSSLLLFHSSYLTFLATASGIAFHYLYCLLRKRPRPSIRALLAATASLLLLILPWVVFTEGWSKPNAFEASSLPLFQRMLFVGGKTATFVNSYLFPVVLAPVLALAIWRSGAGRQQQTRDNLFLLLFVALSTVLLMFLLPWFYFRYLIGLVPVCAMLTGFVVSRIWDYRPVAGGLVLLVLVGTNLMSLALPPHQPGSDLWNFLYEITHDYDGPNEGIARYLSEHGTENQFVITNYGQLPVIFYTNMRTIGFTQNLRVQEQADWIIPRRGRGDESYLRGLARHYEVITLDYPDLFWGNRPDPLAHKYRTVTDAPPVRIYKKREAKR